MSGVAYLINTTPKYFYLLPLHLTLLRRYAAELGWTLYLATEDMEAALVLQKDFPELRILQLDPATESGFLESRLASVRKLATNHSRIFPVQEDFLLEARPMYGRIQEALDLLDKKPALGSVRLMPCPGHAANTYWAESEMLFSYQATLWRSTVYERFLQALIDWIDAKHPGVRSDPARNIAMAVKVNVAEISVGQDILKKVCPYHLCAYREHPAANAVYLAPWPYRPTAVVKGVLQPWAIELAGREGCELSVPA